MRQFLLAKKVAYATGVQDLTLVPDGAVGVYYYNEELIAEMPIVSESATPKNS
jgi:hypothetical protein